MMYGAEQVREPRSLGRRMGDSVIAAVCTGLMAVLFIGMLWTMSHVGCGHAGADRAVPCVFVLLARSVHGRR